MDTSSVRHNSSHNFGTKQNNLGGSNSAKNDRCIYKTHYSQLEEDEIAQIRVIFDSFDPGNRGKISIENLPRILRLLNYNIGLTEIQDLILFVDNKSLGYFSMKELVNLLSQYKFQIDK